MVPDIWDYCAACGGLIDDANCIVCAEALTAESEDDECDGW